MIELFTWTTPNGEKPVLMLEELGLDYTLTLVDLSTGAQKRPAFLRVNPNGRIPALDHDGTRVFESGAILLHLAETTGRLIAATGPDRAEALSWTFFQVGGTGPMIGQLHHFRNAAEPLPYAIQRYEAETARLLGVLDARLADREWLAGDYSIADVINYSWARSGLAAIEGATRFPALAAWAGRIAARPAVVRGLARLAAAKAAL